VFIFELERDLINEEKAFAKAETWMRENVGKKCIFIKNKQICLKKL
jgi:hypothetical protein